MFRIGGDELLEGSLDDGQEWLTHWRYSPGTVALVYLFVGVLWILLSDWLIAVTIPEPTTQHRLQTVKGWIFIVASSGLIYWLGTKQQANLRTAKIRLERLLEQTSVFRRILRHDMRNKCNVIQGHLALIEEQRARESTGRFDTIDAQLDRLVELGEKSTMLGATRLDRQEFDLVDVVTDVADDVRTDHPGATIRVRASGSVRVAADPRLDFVVRELLENAITHAGPAAPNVTLTVRSPDRRTGELAVADDGPGIPDLEREVLDTGVETPLRHSQGVGLLLSKAIVTMSGGRFLVEDNEPRGTVVRVVLPTASPSPTRRLRGLVEFLEDRFRGVAAGARV